MCKEKHYGIWMNGNWATDEYGKLYITNCEGAAEVYAKRFRGEVKLFCKNEEPEEIKPSLNDLNRITTGL